MRARITAIYCLAFLGGTLASVLPLWTGTGIALGVGLAIGCVAPWVWRDSPKRWVWFLAALVAAIACLYVYARVPRPASNDISTLAPASAITVKGKLLETPSQTSSGRARFLLAVQSAQLGKAEPQPVSGKAYTTISLTQATGLRPGQEIQISGSLYLPSPPDYPGAFDFRRYLAQQGAFVGLSGRRIVEVGTPPLWGGWWVRDRMLKAHVMGTGMPEGALLSALVLGNRAVDLPGDLKETFVSVGLAAALAASGFQVSILLGAVLAVSQTCTPRQQFVRGAIVLLGFLGLTGASPSVLRAVVMGFGTLAGLVAQRQTRPVMGLLLTAIFLLLINPLWIWDLGFQLSFLATLGLLVTAEPIARRLEWLPPLVAAELAVPVAAYVWTLPLQIFAFGRLSPYSILANVLTTPLVALGTVGGLLAGLAGVVFVPLGAALSWFLLAPLSLTIAIAQWIYQLPGAVTNAGTIAPWQVLAAYGLLVALWQVPRLGRLWLPALAIAAAVVFVPKTVAASTQFQATLLAANRTPLLLIQHHHTTMLVNSGDDRTVQFDVLPLLQRLGINHIDWAIATDPQPDMNGGWGSLLQRAIPIYRFRDLGESGAYKNYAAIVRQLRGSGTEVQSLAVGRPMPLAPDITVTSLQGKGGVLRLTLGKSSWLLLSRGDPTVQKELLQTPEVLRADVLWWTGDPLAPEFVKAVSPRIAIASTSALSDDVAARIQAANARLYWTGRDGAIQWRPSGDIQLLGDRDDSASPL